MVPNSEDKTLTCIICPVSCVLTVNHTKQKIHAVEGHQCKKGKVYAQEEILDPRRTLTTTVAVRSGELPLVSVRTDRPIPKDKIFSIMAELLKLTVSAPVVIGDIIIMDIKNTGANIIATKTVNKFNQ